MDQAGVTDFVHIVRSLSLHQSAWVVILYSVRRINVFPPAQDTLQPTNFLREVIREPPPPSLRAPCIPRTIYSHTVHCSCRTVVEATACCKQLSAGLFIDLQDAGSWVLPRNDFLRCNIVPRGVGVGNGCLVRNLRFDVFTIAWKTLTAKLIVYSTECHRKLL